jgi:hypothetical protein
VTEMHETGSVGFKRVTTLPEGVRLSMDDLRTELKRRVKEAGGMHEFCRRKGIQGHTGVSLAVSGKREVTEQIANACGFIREVTFRKITQ